MWGLYVNATECAGLLPKVAKGQVCKGPDNTVQYSTPAINGPHGAPHIISHLPTEARLVELVFCTVRRLMERVSHIADSGISVATECGGAKRQEGQYSDHNQNQFRRAHFPF